MNETHLCPALCIRLAKCCFVQQSVLGLGVLFDPSAPFEVAASAVLITCPAEPWVSAGSRQWRGWCGHAQRSASLVLIPELFQLNSNRNLVLCSVCASSASVFGMVPNNGKALMSDFSDLCLFIYLFILSMVNLTICQLTIVTHHFWVLLCWKYPCQPSHRKIQRTPSFLGSWNT